MTKKTILGTAAVVGLLFAGQSPAVLVSEACLSGSAQDLLPSSNCTYIYDDASQTGGANDSESALNGLDVFGFDAWELFGKEEESGGSFSDDGSDEFNFTVTSTATGENVNQGLWSFDLAAWDTFDPILLTMKDGNNAAEAQTKQNGFYSYLLAATDSNGTWTTENSFSGKSLSHMSAYGVASNGNGGGITPPAVIPAPGTLALMGLGLLALTAVQRRRS